MQPTASGWAKGATTVCLGDVFHIACRPSYGHMVASERCLQLQAAGVVCSQAGAPSADCRGGSQQGTTVVCLGGVFQVASGLPNGSHSG